MIKVGILEFILSSSSEFTDWAYKMNNYLNNEIGSEPNN